MEQKMIVFEVGSKVLIANNEEQNERLFQVDLTDAEILSDDKIIYIESATQVRRYTAAGSFMTWQAHLGDQLILSADGNWKIQHSLRSYAIVAWNRLSYYCKEATFWLKNALKTEKLGSIERKVAPISDFVAILLPNVDIS